MACAHLDAAACLPALRPSQDAQNRGSFAADIRETMDAFVSASFDAAPDGARDASSEAARRDIPNAEAVLPDLAFRTDETLPGRDTAGISEDGSTETAEAPADLSIISLDSALPDTVDAPVELPPADRPCLPSGIETCNGIDDDCNGIVDDIAPTSCGTSLGACRPGTQVCVGGRPVCAGEIRPTVELCDGIDNDCDGTEDNPFQAQLRQSCPVGVGACRRTGTWGCAPGGLGVICSATPGAPGDERTHPCNRIDDDCDGVVDYRMVNGRPVSVCECKPVRVQAASWREDESSQPLCDELPASLTCSIDAQSRLVMRFCLAATAGNFWAQCIFESVSLDAFDPDHDGEGLLDISYETDVPLRAAIDAYVGAYPKRKKMRIWTPSTTDPELSAGPHRVLVRPSDLECPRYAPLQDPPNCLPPDFTKPEKCIPSTCRAGCVQGRWAAGGHPECKFSYTGVPFYLTFESAGKGSEQRQQGQITVLSIYHHPSPCVCREAGDCQDPQRRICDLSTQIDGTGVCVP